MPQLPPGVSAATFADAIKAMQSAVGAEWVFTSDEDVDLYRDGYSLFHGEPEDRVASAAVAPANVEQVQAVVRWAREHDVAERISEAEQAVMEAGISMRFARRK